MTQESSCLSRLLNNSSRILRDSIRKLGENGKFVLTSSFSFQLFSTDESFEKMERSFVIELLSNLRFFY